MSYKYRIGDRARAFDVFEYKENPRDFSHKFDSLKEGDGAFIYHRYCIVVEAGFTLMFGRYIVFQCKSGSGRESRVRFVRHPNPRWPPPFAEEHLQLFADDAKRPPYQKWAGSLDTLLEVDLGTQQLILRKPPNGDMYTKQQCLQIVNGATAKSTKERRQLIQFLAGSNLVPNGTALYKLLQRDEKGLPIRYDDWGVPQKQPTPQPVDVMLWTSRAIPDPLPRASLSKKRKSVRKCGASEGEITRWDIWNEKGWRGHIRLMVIPVRELSLEVIGSVVSRTPPVLIDICSYIGMGGRGPFGSLHGVERRNQPCRLYFDPIEYPPPQFVDYGGKTATFERLKSYIRHVAAKDLSPVYCNGGSKKYRSKEFTCNKKYCNRDGKWKKCPFYFQVRWDAFGYYIHLHRESKSDDYLLRYIHNCGSAWHCCKG